jgi:ketosteroid isomerase-like protein
MRALYAADVISEEVATGEKVRGLDRLEEKVSLPADLRRQADWSVRNLWCEGQTIVVEWEARLPPERPGSPRIPLREIAIHEVRNGKIVRERFYYDASSQP